MVKRNNPLELELLREMEERGILNAAASAPQDLPLIDASDPQNFLGLLPMLEDQAGEVGGVLEFVNSNVSPEEMAAGSGIPEEVIRASAHQGPPITPAALEEAVNGEDTPIRPMVGGATTQATPPPILEEVNVPPHPVPPMLTGPEVMPAGSRPAPAPVAPVAPVAPEDPGILAVDAGVSSGGGPNRGGILSQAEPQAESEDSGGFLSRLLSPTLPEGMNWKDTLFNMGVGMMMSEGNTFQKIGTGLSRAALHARQRQEDARKARHDEQQARMNELRMRQLEHDMASGDVRHLGNGILWDFNNQQQVAPELVDMFNQQREQELASRARYARQSQSFSPGRYSTNYFYNEQQEPVFWRTNDRTGQVEYLVNDQWTTERPEGSLVRPEDSVVKHTNRIDGKRFEEIAEAGTAARSTMGTVNEMRRVLAENPDLYTGAGAGTFDGMRRWAMALGLGGDRADKVASFDELRNLTMNLVLNRVAQTKGAISDREMAAFERSVPNLTQTREGIERTLAIMERSAQRAMEMDDFFAARMHHMPYYQVKEQWDAYINTNDAISDLIPEEDTIVGTPPQANNTEFDNRTPEGVGFRIRQ